MKKFTRVLAVVVAMVLLVTIPAMAVEFVPSAEAKAAEVASLADATGNAVAGAVVIADADADAKVDLVDDVVADLIKDLEKPEVAALFDVTATGAAADALANGGLKITFSFAGVTAADKVIVLHKAATGWEVVPSTVAADEITATFTSLSPVAFVFEAAEGGQDSPATGANDYTAFAVIGMAIVACAAAVVIKKTCIDR